MCNFCSATFANPGNCRMHERTVHMGHPKKYFCLVCEKEVLTGKVAHIEKYHNEKDGNLKCPKCDKTFPNFTELGWFPFIFELGIFFYSYDSQNL